MVNAVVMPTPDAADLKRLSSARFELRRRLGAGGFGEVYEAFDRERGARVALKILRRVSADDLYRFKQEFRALADLTHPNLVRLYDLVGEPDRWVFTMELVDGVDVVEFTRPDGRTFDELRLRAALVQLAEGLSALHAAGKIHRDIKPSNVLVDRQGRVLLVDFGLAARLSQSGEMSRVVLIGTPVYFAPEQVQGEAASTASDWYAVGVILYEALTGQLPFQGSMQAVMAQKLVRLPAAPSSLLYDIPPDLEQLVMELLARRPEERPTDEEVLQRLGGPAPARAGRRRSPFVGRADERARLAELFRAVKDEHVTATAIVSGPSGIGKSALVERALADVRRAAPGALILAGRCYAQESVPYKAIDALIDPLSRHLAHLPERAVVALLPDGIRALARIFPVLEHVPAIAHAPAARLSKDVPQVRRWAFRALRELLAALGRERPLVLVIDDLQWGDPESGAVLVELLAPPGAPPLLLVVTVREDDVATSPCFQAALPALRDPALRSATFALGALADPEARELCRALLPVARAGDEAMISAIAREAGGRPFFVRELAELPDARRDEVVSLDALVRTRASELPEGARALLELICLAARPVDRAAAARAAALGDGEPAATHALQAARLARRSSVAGRDDLEVYHDRIREAVVAGLSPSRRSDGFRRLAAALAEAGRGDPETLSAYYLEAGDQVRAADLASVAAAEAARALAFDRAARLYQRSLDLRPGRDARRRATLEALGEALVHAGRSAEAGQVLGWAAEGAPPDRAFELRRQAAEQNLCAGLVDEGMEGFRHALAEVDLRFPEPRWRAAVGLLFWLSWVWARGFRCRVRPPEEIAPAALRRIDTCATAAKSLLSIDALLAAYFAMRMTALALVAGEPLRVVEALALFAGFTSLLRGKTPAVAERAMASLAEAATATHDPYAEAIPLLVEGATEVLTGNREAAAGSLDRCAAILRERASDRRWAINVADELCFLSLAWSGAWQEAGARLPAALAEARGRGNLHMERLFTLRAGHLPGLLADDPEAALRAHASARVGWWPQRFSSLDHYALLQRGDIALYAVGGRGVEPYRIVEEAQPALAASGLMRFGALRMLQLGLRARAALACAAADGAAAEREAALAVAERATRGLGRSKNLLARGLSPFAEAGLLDARGRNAAAADAYLRAAESLTAVGCHHYAAAARRRRGELLGDPRQIEKADAWLRAQGAANPARLAAMLAPGRSR
jgi:hypothetical protein